MKIHMIGIGGIGMSALAQLFLMEGARVSGSDRDPSPMTELLEKKGIRTLIGQKAENVPKDANLVVYSDAVWEDNPERMHAKELGIRQVSYFEALGQVSAGRYTIAVSGTHGKTTVTALITKVLKDAGQEPTAIVGSLVPEFGSNFVPGKKGLFVVEACEYKDHLLKLSPKLLVITNIEWDHTDWFSSLSAMQDTFREAVHAVRDEGVIVANPDDQNVAPVLFGARVPVVDYAKENVPALKLIGEFNRQNARAAKAAVRAFAPHLPEAAIDRSLAAYGGSWRRFEKKGIAEGGAEVYDDYAHHPTAIRETLRAVRAAFPGKKIIVAFHPHLYSRTRDLMDGFAGAFGDADEVLLAPIYAAREEPIPGVTSDALAKKIAVRGTSVQAIETLDFIERRLRGLSSPDALILTMGAGDIYKIADRLVH